MCQPPFTAPAQPAWQWPLGTFLSTCCCSAAGLCRPCICAEPSAISQLQHCSWVMQLMEVQDPELFLGQYLQAHSCHLRSYRGWPVQFCVAMQTPHRTAEQDELDNDEFALAEFLADLRASSTPPAATRVTRTLPELPTFSSSPVLGALQPANTHSLEVRCLACQRLELALRLWVPDRESLTRRSCSNWPAAGE